MVAMEDVQAQRGKAREILANPADNVVNGLISFVASIPVLIIKKEAYAVNFARMKGMMLAVLLVAVCLLGTLSVVEGGLQLLHKECIDKCAPKKWHPVQYGLCWEPCERQLHLHEVGDIVSGGLNAIGSIGNGKK
ncbi:hypothetical protein BV898_11065 [Hypsibius exemplaris]|uniref:Uncharacterized protein n=1 Tax=Hypsibius exemplaris TaxID=2072580 RepID=A0A1W0WHM7_HYPEX|nr:hypothetical protein BV898_11065 [Hypsibius exemplaris]